MRMAAACRRATSTATLVSAAIRKRCTTCSGANSDCLSASSAARRCVWSAESVLCSQPCVASMDIGQGSGPTWRRQPVSQSSRSFHRGRLITRNTPQHRDDRSAPRQLPYLVGLLCGDSALALLHLRGLRRLLRLPGGLVVVAVLLRASLRTPAKRRPAPSRAAAAGLGVRAVRTTARPTSRIAVRAKEERGVLSVLRILRIAHRLLLLARSRRGLGAALPACRAWTRYRLSVSDGARARAGAATGDRLR